MKNNYENLCKINSSLKLENRSFKSKIENFERDISLSKTKNEKTMKKINDFNKGKDCLNNHLFYRNFDSEIESTLCRILIRTIDSLKMVPIIEFVIPRSDISP